MARVTHFEIPAGDPQRSMKFYNIVFGWTFERFGDYPYWLANTGANEIPGINGAIIKRNHPSQPVTNNISVPSIDQAISCVESAGGRIVVPKTQIPGVGYSCFFKDPDGNIFGILQPDNPAK